MKLICLEPGSIVRLSMGQASENIFEVIGLSCDHLVEMREVSQRWAMFKNFAY